MAKKPDITTITTGYFSTTMLNNNFEALQNGFDNTLSLDGSTPNAMSADFDLNDNDILNAGTVNTDVLKVAGVQVTDATYVPEWEGEWTTSTSYVVNDLVRQDGNVYICLEAHTSGTFSTDLAASKWELFASKGSAGTGTGDLLSTNNLSDLTDADAALSNLGGLTKGIEIFKDSTSGDVLTTLGVEAQSTATWETGTGTTESVVSPAKVKAAIDAVAPELTQVQAEDDTDTTFGLVSGQRLGQSIESNLNVTGSAPMYACRAWVNFNGTGTVSIRDSGNVSSITDNGTGDYTVNFTTAMPDANYAVCVAGREDLGGVTPGESYAGLHRSAQTTGAVRVGVGDVTFDFVTMMVAVFR